MSETSTLSVKELKAQIAALQAQVEAVRAKEITDAVARIHALIAEHELSVEHIFPSFKATKPQKDASTSATEKPRVPAKYHHSGTDKFWSGRGLMPRDFKEAIANGAKIEDFLIKPELETASLL